jgi:hypothetical protein
LQQLKQLVSQHALLVAGANAIDRAKIANVPRIKDLYIFALR